MKQSKKLILSSLVGLSLLTNVAKATSEEFKDGDSKQMIASAALESSNLVINPHVWFMVFEACSNLKDAIAFARTNKANAAILYNTAYWRDFLSTRYQDVPKNIFESQPFIWINLNTTENIYNRPQTVQRMQSEYREETGKSLDGEQWLLIDDALVRLEKRYVSLGRWVEKSLPALEATKNLEDLCQYLPSRLATIDGEIEAAEFESEKTKLRIDKDNYLQSANLPKSIELRLAFLENFEDLMKGKAFICNIGDTQWQITPAMYNDLFNYGHRMNIIRENILNFPLVYSSSRYQFVNGGSVVGSGQLKKIDPVLQAVIVQE